MFRAVDSSHRNVHRPSARGARSRRRGAGRWRWGVPLVALAFWLRFVWVLAVPTVPVGDFATYRESANYLLEFGSLDHGFIYMPGFVLMLAGRRGAGRRSAGAEDDRRGAGRPGGGGDLRHHGAARWMRMPAIETATARRADAGPEFAGLPLPDRRRRDAALRAVAGGRRAVERRRHRRAGGGADPARALGAGRVGRAPADRRGARLRRAHGPGGVRARRRAAADADVGRLLGGAPRPHELAPGGAAHGADRRRRRWWCCCPGRCATGASTARSSSPTTTAASPRSSARTRTPRGRTRARSTACSRISPGARVLDEPHRETDQLAFDLAKDWTRFEPRYALGLAILEGRAAVLVGVAPALLADRPAGRAGRRARALVRGAQRRGERARRRVLVRRCARCSPPASRWRSPSGAGACWR